MRIRQALYLGVLAGVVAWLEYAVVECWFSSILVRLSAPSRARNFFHTPANWRWTLLLFASYPIIGAISGGLGALILRALRPRTPKSALLPVATFCVVLIYTINGHAFLPVLAVGTLLSLALVFRLGFVSNAWTASLILLGAPWTWSELLADNSMAKRSAATVTYVAAILAASWLIHRLRKSKAELRVRSLITPALSIALTAGLVALLGRPSQARTSGTAPPGHPNVTLIVMDTVRADHLGLYGYERDTTPNLARLARESALYQHAMAPSDMTLSSHASMFTGLYARAHGAHMKKPSLGSPLDARFPTMAELLSKEGYRTMGIVANHAYLGHDFRLDRGFQYYSVEVPIFVTTWDFYLEQTIRDLIIPRLAPADYERRYVKAVDINDRARSVLQERRNDRAPFFLFLNYMDAHWPRLPPPPFNTQYPEDPHSPDEGDDVLDVSQYDGALAYLDFEIGELIAELKRLDLYDDTLIIITSDHGEAFGERGLFRHGVSVYQDQVHVPLIIKYPGQKQGEVVAEVVSLVDLLPTILNRLGYTAPAGIPGRDLSARDSARTQPVLSEHYPKPFWDGPSMQAQAQRAIFEGSYKLLHSSRGQRELYDLLEDPTEKNDLCPGAELLCRRLDEKLDRWLAAVAAEASPAGKLSKEALERLKSLGYVQ